MKKILLVLALTATPACSTLKEVLDIPGAVISDATGAVDTVLPGDQAIADTAGAAAATAATGLTGNPAAGAAAGALVTGLAAWLLSKRRKAAA